MTNQKAKFTLEDLYSDSIDDSSDIPEIEPVITIGEANFAVKGDIAIVGGQPKTGKTTISSFMMATAFMHTIPEDLDCLNIRTTYCDGKPVVYVDTEQPKAYTNKLRKQTVQLIGKGEHPKNLLIFNFRKYSSEEKKDRVFALMKSLPDAHLWIIDGVADLINDPNNVEQSFKIIENFMVASDKLNTTVVLYIHKNPGIGAKLRGNLGSEAERKCGGAISLSKDKDIGIHTIKPMMIRGSEDFDPIHFKWSKVDKRVYSLSPEDAEIYEKKTDPAERKLELHTRIADKITLSGMEHHKHADLIQKIMEASMSVEGRSSPIAVRTADNRLKDMISYELLEKDEITGLYSRNNA